MILTTGWSLQAKKCRIIFLKLFTKNVFSISKAIFCKFTFVNTKIYSMCTQWPQNLCINCFTHVCKKEEFYADFIYMEIIRKKCAGKSQTPTVKEVNVLALFWSGTFITAFFCFFSTVLEFCIVFLPFKLYEENIFRSF